jgi:hypothetical protein
MWSIVWKQKKNQYFWNFVGILRMSLQLPWRHWEYRHMGCGAKSQLASEFLVADSTSKKTPHFLALSAETGFSKFKA